MFSLQVQGLKPKILILNDVEGWPRCCEALKLPTGAKHREPKERFHRLPFPSLDDTGLWQSKRGVACCSLGAGWQPEHWALPSSSLSFPCPFPCTRCGPKCLVPLNWVGNTNNSSEFCFFLFRVKLNICSACSGCHQTVKARAGLGYLSCSGVLQLRFLPTDLIWAQRRFAHEIKNSYLPQKSALRRPWAACIGWSSYSFTWVIVLRDEER